MPNWCYTSLSVVGPAARVAEFVEFAKSKTDDSALSFENFVPMPDALRITAGSEAEIGYAVFHSATEWQRVFSYPWVKEQNISTLDALREHVSKTHPNAQAQGKLYADNLALYGAKNWYDWSIAYWGTKWDACSVKLEHHCGDEAVFMFETAWSPAMPAILAMSQQFPDLTFSGSFDEEAEFFKFEATWFGGEQTSELDLMIAEQ